ncbi:MAG TPA: S8 family serine peptidase [Mycobacteriales bacterium]|nr:S8 family serine peptidase [Mycobacteriales bacterium]
MRASQLRRALLAAVTVAGSLALALPGSAATQPQTWHADQARVPGAQGAGRNGSGVVVAVIDTWVDPRHPAFGGRVLAGADCVGGCKAGAAAPDRCEHGTHVAGTVAAADYGVAPAARILPLRVLAWDAAEQLCTGSSDDAADAIRFAVRAGAKVINLSLGGSVPLVQQDPDMISAVAEAANAGVVVVFAAGNKSYPVTDQYGANALIVAATDNAGRLPSYSQRGAGVDLAAPGGDAPSGTCTAASCVASLWPNGEYAAMAGTSMAAPHVSALAALLIAQAPSRGRADVIATMRRTARPVGDAGDGLIDMTAALRVRAPAASKPSPRPTSARPRPSTAPSPARPPATRQPAPVAPPTASRPAVPAPIAKPAAAATLGAPTPSPSPEPFPTGSASPSAPPRDDRPVAISAAPAPSRALPAGAAAALAALAAAGLAFSADPKRRYRRPAA